MDLKMPVLIVLFGPEACSLSKRLTDSIVDHLSPGSLASVILWLVDAAGDLPENNTPFLRRELYRVSFSAENYAETCFMKDYQALTERQVENAALLNYCCLCAITCGNEASGEIMAKVRDGADAIQRHWNRMLRSHLIWLTEDSLLKADENYRLLADDVVEGNHDLGGFDRITVLSSTQNSGASTYATRQERLDAIVPCLLETANAATLTGKKIQTLAYRKLSCTSAEIRRLVGHRVLEKLMEWQAGPIGNIPLWELVATEDMPFGDIPNYEASVLCGSLSAAIRRSLPAPADLLMLERPDRVNNGYALLEDFVRNNQTELLEHLSGAAWANGWIAEVESSLRRCFALRTALDFFEEQGVFRNKLTAMVEAAEAQIKALGEPSAPPPGTGWLQNRKRADAAAFLAVANGHLERISYLVLKGRLKRMLALSDGLAVFIRDRIAESARALEPHRLTPEALALYTALAPTYDKAARDAIDQLTLDNRTILGESRLHYPQDIRMLEAAWEGYHRRMMEAVFRADASLANNFTGAYVRGKASQQIERDIRDKLNRCVWQLSGGTIGDTGEATYFANHALCDYFPQNQIDQYPLRRIPGDLVEYLRFGNVADSLDELTQFPVFREVQPFKPNEAAMDETAHDRTDAAQVEPADGGAAAPEEPNPWHIRLDRRKDDFMLYWVWPEGHSEDAVIRFTHADGRQTSMPCAIDFYARDMGRAIPADKLGVGRNRVTICYDRLMRSADVMGRRVKVYYGVTAGKRSRAMQLEDDRVELYPFTLRFHAEGDSVRQSLRLALRIQGGIPIRYSLPEGVCNAEGVESVSFHATAAEAELVCTDGCADMLEIVRREPF